MDASSESQRQGFSSKCMRAFLRWYRHSDFFQAVLIVSPYVVFSFFAARSVADACGPVRELRPLLPLALGAAWCVAVVIALVVAKTSHFFSCRLRPVWGAVLIVVLFHPLDIIGHALAEDRALAIRKTNGLETEFAGTGADWRELYSEIHGISQGVRYLQTSQFLSAPWDILIEAPIWLPLVLLCGWIVRRTVKNAGE